MSTITSLKPRPAWRDEKPHPAEREYTPLSAEKDLMTACSQILGFNRIIPLVFWDDWILRETDELIQERGAIEAGREMKKRLRWRGRGIMRGIWKNCGRKKWVTR